MFGLINNKPPLDEDSTAWIFDAFDWCLQQFSADYFFAHAVLVVPDNQYFPGRADSNQGMAELIFNHVKRYAGMSHWPTRVTEMSACALQNPEPVAIDGPLLSHDSRTSLSSDTDRFIEIPYNPQQINNPEGLIASFAHISAHYLGQMANEPPPGGVELWPHITEVLAIYLGFGLMFANSAYTFRGGCGSCYNPAANRDAYLTEQQSVYTLALFTQLKQLPAKQVSTHLKKHLRGFFKQSLRDIEQRPQAFQRLAAFNSELTRLPG